MFVRKWISAEGPHQYILSQMLAYVLIFHRRKTIVLAVSLENQ